MNWNEWRTLRWAESRGYAASNCENAALVERNESRCEHQQSQNSPEVLQNSMVVLLRTSERSG